MGKEVVSLIQKLEECKIRQSYENNRTPYGMRLSLVIHDHNIETLMSCS